MVINTQIRHHGFDESSIFCSSDDSGLVYDHDYCICSGDGSGDGYGCGNGSGSGFGSGYGDGNGTGNC